jgi:hypothetical protein
MPRWPILAAALLALAGCTHPPAQPQVGFSVSGAGRAQLGYGVEVDMHAVQSAVLPWGASAPAGRGDEVASLSAVGTGELTCTINWPGRVPKVAAGTGSCIVTDGPGVDPPRRSGSR